MREKDQMYRLAEMYVDNDKQSNGRVAVAKELLSARFDENFLIHELNFDMKTIQRAKHEIEMKMTKDPEDYMDIYKIWLHSPDQLAKAIFYIEAGTAMENDGISKENMDRVFHIAYNIYLDVANATPTAVGMQLNQLFQEDEEFAYAVTHYNNFDYIHDTLEYAVKWMI